MDERTYKDGNRDWWKITISEPRVVPAPDEPGVIDYWWPYTLWKEDGIGGFREVLSGEVFGLGDQLPYVCDVLQDVAQKIVVLTTGFAACHGSEVCGTLPNNCGWRYAEDEKKGQ